MKLLVAAIMIASLGVTSAAVGQRAPNWIAGNSLAGELLRRLANPKDTAFQVGIINSAAEIGVLISPKGSALVAEHFSGYSTNRQSGWKLTWTAREQLNASSEELVFEVNRKTIRSRGCAELNGSLNRFYTELETVLQTPVLLSNMPPNPQLSEVTLDGTSYIIQIWTGERLLVIFPDQDRDKTLDSVSAELMRVIGICSVNRRSSIEEHYVW